MISVGDALFLAIVGAAFYLCGIYDARRWMFHDYEQARLAYSRERMRRIRGGF